jgi:hypothetical protein
MNSQERQVIDDIFRRLEQAASQPRDPEAERFIAEKLRQQPYAPYAMAQLIYVQEEAIKSLNQQLEETRAQAERGREQEGGFLSSIFGGGSRREPAPERPAGSPWGGQAGAAGYGQPNPGYGQAGGYGGAPQPGPWGGGGQPGMAGGMQPQAAGGGFLRGALTTAAGVAGGMVAGNALMNAFGGGHHQTLGSLSNSDTAALTGGDNSSFGAGADGGGGGYGDLSPFPDSGGAGVQDASYDPNEDMGGDFGGDSDGGDWT